ncbi:hypothetical protein BDW59DRAFT_164506 [Aspergillus cavernicola]|uniref:Uncharacterized protein n=1 Tax=Aspergillus cavernicola TaxID=176166 RepID=A0ABR4I1E3_9EURO
MLGNPQNPDPNQIPRISLNLADHWIAISIAGLAIFTGSGLLPVILYLVLTKVAKLGIRIVLSVIASTIGAASVLAMLRRIWQLIRPDSTCRPLNARRYELDYFQWNFFTGFIYISALMIVAISTSHEIGDISIRLVSLPIPILILQTTSQLLCAWVLIWLRAKYPFRVSSMETAALVRPGIYTIVEDVVAVDGGQGQKFRELLDARYRSSKPVRVLLERLDLAWGLSGVVVSTVLIAMISTLPNMDVLFVIGWLVPWAWAAVLAVSTRSMWKTALMRENLNQVK